MHSCTLVVEPVLVVHGRDLRTFDNPALREAERQGNPVPVYLFQDSEMRCSARRNFLLESLKDLNRQYEDLNTGLCVTRKSLETLRDETGAEHVVHTLDPRTALTGYSAANPGFLQESGRNRDTWDENLEFYLREQTRKPPEELPENPLESELGDIDPENEKKRKERPRGGRKEAVQRMEVFGRGPTDYVSSISSPSEAEEKGSRLSAHIAYGCVSVREAYQEAGERMSGADLESLQDRLSWNLHMRQKLLDNPEIPEKEINPVFRGFHRANTNTSLVEAWKQGRTGFPMVDASMRALVDTGFINFRMRAMCASFYTHILRQWWKEGADFMYRHLVDADPAINYYQWQMQSNLTGIHPLRIYNPVKQQEENDPEGEFIRSHIPELRDFPEERIAEPWKTSKQMQENAGCVIGEDYPEPVVDFDRQARRTRDQFSDLSDRAKEVFADEEVWNQASLSGRHDRQEILDDNSETENSTLADF